MDDNFWLIVSAMLVFTMQAGFLCLESGRIRSKNSINVAAKNVAVLIIGPRTQRFERSEEMPQGSNLPFSALGVLLLWFGWFGFNGGSSLLFDSSVPVVLLNTCLAAAFAGLVSSSIHYFYHKYINVPVLLNGVVGGLVGITASCFAVDASGAAVVGIVSGILVYYGDGEMAQTATSADILREFVRANSNSMQQLATQTSPELLKNSIELLNNAENIYIVGLGRSFSISSYLTYAFRHLNKRAFLIDGLGGMFREQLSMVGPKDVVIAISFSPYSKETTAISDILAQSGTKQIIITDSQISPLFSFSDVCFVVKEAKVDAFRSQAASFCLAQTLAVSLAFGDHHNQYVEKESLG